METSLAGLVFSFSSDESARNGSPRGRKGRGDYSPGIIYHPYCLRRLLAGHYVPPQLPAATARQALCTTPIACGDCSTGIIPTPIACGDCSPGIMYHPYCPRRLLDKHCTHPYYLRRLLAGLFSLPKRAKIAEKCPIF